MKEIWKDIEGYDGLYEVSNFGRVRNADKILKPHLRKDGYYQILLYTNGIGKAFYVHRLVAGAFIPNPDNLPCVNHKSEVKTENFVENLEWCSYRYNNLYNDKQIKINLKRTNGKMSKKVFQYTKEGEFLKEWPSVKEIERSLGLARQNISACCLGKYNLAYGYKWLYAS